MKRVAIIGGGFGGIAVAHTLCRLLREGEAEITLFDSQGAHGYTPLFFESAAAGVQKGSERFASWTGSALPFTHAGMWSRLSRVRLRREEVQRVDTSTKRIFLVSGDSYQADAIFFAMGATNSMGRVPGASEHGIAFKTLADVARVQRLLGDLAVRGGLAHVLIVGGGPSALELAAQIVWLGKRNRANKTLWHVTVVESRDRILATETYRATKIAEKRLRSLGVDVEVGKRVERVEEGKVWMVGADGVAQTMHADGVIFAAGTSPRPQWQEWGLPVDAVGWVCVDAYGQVEGMPGLYAVGDMATHGAVSAPKRAPVALAQGEAAARAAIRVWRGRPVRKPFWFATWKKWPIAIPLGGRSGLAAWGPVAIGGFFGWAIRCVADAQYFFTVLSFSEAWRRWWHGVRASHD